MLKILSISIIFFSASFHGRETQSSPPRQTRWRWKCSADGPRLTIAENPPTAKLIFAACKEKVAGSVWAGQGAFWDGLQGWEAWLLGLSGQPPLSDPSLHRDSFAEHILSK